MPEFGTIQRKLSELRLRRRRAVALEIGLFYATALLVCVGAAVTLGELGFTRTGAALLAVAVLGGAGLWLALILLNTIRGLTLAAYYPRLARGVVG